MDAFGKFIRSWSVYSKTAGKPVSAYCNGIKYVFIEGWPMTVGTYSLLTLKSVFGGNTRLRVDEWEKLHLETRTLCQGLNLPLIEGKEAQSLVKLFRNIMDISADALTDEKVVLAWVKMLDDTIQEAETETGA